MRNRFKKMYSKVTSLRSMELLFSSRFYFYQNLNSLGNVIEMNVIEMLVPDGYLIGIRVFHALSRDTSISVPDKHLHRIVNQPLVRPADWWAGPRAHWVQEDESGIIKQPAALTAPRHSLVAYRQKHCLCKHAIVKSRN